MKPKVQQILHAIYMTLGRGEAEKTFDLFAELSMAYIINAKERPRRDHPVAGAPDLFANGS